MNASVVTVSRDQEKTEVVKRPKELDDFDRRVEEQHARNLETFVRQTEEKMCKVRDMFVRNYQVDEDGSESVDDKLNSEPVSILLRRRSPDDVSGKGHSSH